MQILGVRTPILEEHVVRRRSAIVPLDRGSVSSYRLSIVTMPITGAVWRSSQCKSLGVQSVPSCKRMGRHRGSVLVPQGSSRATLFASSNSFSIRRTI